MSDSVIPISQIKAIVEPLKQAGKKIVMTNGCFDILHIGHKRYLEKSKALADVLIVAINADTSVKELKGNDRPINNESDRAELLAALKSVDYVIIFEDLTAVNLLKEIQPDFYTKGGDYSQDHLEKWPEYQVAKELGIEVVLIDMVEGKSTTNMIAKTKIIS